MEGGGPGRGAPSALSIMALPTHPLWAGAGQAGWRGVAGGWVPGWQSLWPTALEAQGGVSGAAACSSLGTGPATEQTPARVWLRVHLPALPSLTPHAAEGHTKN